MQDEHRSNKSTWLIIALLSSPVIVSIMDMTKEAIFGPKEHKSMKLLEAALNELIAARRPEQSREHQKVVYIPVPQQTYVPQPVTFHLVHHTRSHPRSPIMAHKKTSPLLEQESFEESLPTLHESQKRMCDLMHVERTS